MVPKLCEEILEKKSSWIISKRPVLPYNDYRDRVKEIDPLVSDELVQISSNYIQDMGEVCSYKSLYNSKCRKHYHYISLYFPYFPTHGAAEGDQRRQRTSYVYGILHTLDSENNLNQDAITSLAAGRCSWKTFKVACSTVDY